MKEVNQVKNDIQPKYEAVTVVCNGCGTVIETRSTKESINVEVCSKCHPFYTGSQKNTVVGGRSERFKKKFNITDED